MNKRETLKSRLKNKNHELYSKCIQLKLSAADSKKYVEMNTGIKKLTNHNGQSVLFRLCYCFSAKYL